MIDKDFMEAIHWLIKTLNDIEKYFGNRYIAICRELTKIYETTYVYRKQYS